MKEFLKELKKEASCLSTKSLGPIGFDYRRRTKLERLLFIIAKEYCKNKLKYDLGGLGGSHQKMFSEYTQTLSCVTEDIENVHEAFKISEMICNLSSSDPYAREGTMEELGGSIFVIFENLSKRIMAFIDKFEE
jgi:hypothetical protein